MNYNPLKITIHFSLILLGFLSWSISYSMPIFKVEFMFGASNFPSNLGVYDPPVERLLRITNQSTVTMAEMIYLTSDAFAIDQSKSTCGTVLAPNSSCTLALFFTPNKLGHFVAQLKVCGQNGAWCSKFPPLFDITVTQNTLVSKSCNTIANRPFSTLNCQSSSIYANNFKTFIEQILHKQAGPESQFSYFQQIPSQNETTTPCLEAQQSGVTLDPEIKGGGESLCNLMSYSTNNASMTNNPALSKLFPPYLNFLLATSYPITPNTVPLDELNQLHIKFATPDMDSSVRSLGYLGYITFLSSYYLEQIQKTYENCGTSEICPGIYYLPYLLTGNKSSLEVWPPLTQYWGSSAGGGSGAGYQIEAFKPGSSIHYTLFSGGGGGGAGNTTPERVNSIINLINVGSGGGGGSQFSDCFSVGSDNLNGLGLGAGTGSGLSIPKGSNVTFTAAPAVDYSFYPPVTHPTWNHNTVLTQYGLNLTYLFQTLIPQLYDEGYTISISGGGGGGTGLEFLNNQGQEYLPHPVSIGYGFNFCYVFNKNNQYEPTDCISSTAVSISADTLGTDLDTLIYQNLGNFYNQGMELAILPQHCNGYTDFRCTCTFQHAFVICELDQLLRANHYTTTDIPTWLINPHCNESQLDLESSGQVIDQYKLSNNNNTSSCQQSVGNYFQTKSTTSCAAPWG